MGIIKMSSAHACNHPPFPCCPREHNPDQEQPIAVRSSANAPYIQQKPCSLHQNLYPSVRARQGAGRARAYAQELRAGFSRWRAGVHEWMPHATPNKRILAVQKSPATPTIIGVDMGG